MSLKAVNHIDTNVVELEIEIGAEAFEAAVENAYLKNREKIALPGFRKGKAPRKMIEKMYGEGVFYEDAVNALYPDAYDKAVSEAKITPVDKADIEVVSMGKEGFVFKAKVTVKPEVELGEYKGLPVDKMIYTVTDADVDAEVDKVRQRNSRLVTVEDRAAENGDTAVIDFDGYVDSVPFEGGKGSNHSLKLGSGQFIPGFEDQLIGKKAGDEVDVNVSFPEDYHEASLAGKPALFKVKIHELKFNELPELDDEFAKDVSEFDTLEAYKADIRAKLTEQKEKQSQNEMEEKLIDAVIGGMKAEIPEVMFEKQLDNIVADYDQRMRSQGMNLETYLQYTGSDLENFRKMFREVAERQVKIRLALEKISELENIVIGDAELEDEYKRIAEQYKIDVEKVKPFIHAEELAKDIAVGKAVELVKNSAAVTEKAPETAAEPEAAGTKAEEPAKKTVKKTRKKVETE